MHGQTRKPHEVWNCCLSPLEGKWFPSKHHLVHLIYMAIAGLFKVEITVRGSSKRSLMITMSCFLYMDFGHAFIQNTKSRGSNETLWEIKGHMAVERTGFHVHYHYLHSNYRIFCECVILTSHPTHNPPNPYSTSDSWWILKRTGPCWAAMCMCVAVKGRAPGRSDPSCWKWLLGHGTSPHRRVRSLSSCSSEALARYSGMQLNAQVSSGCQDGLYSNLRDQRQGCVYLSLGFALCMLGFS